jgi:hypothetical protein
MFADGMLETSWAQRSRRGWMTLTSLGLQALAAAFLLLLPLIGTTALPPLRPLSPPVSFGATAGAIPHAFTSTVHRNLCQQNVGKRAARSRAYSNRCPECRR